MATDAASRTVVADPKSMEELSGLVVQQQRAIEALQEELGHLRRAVAALRARVSTESSGEGAAHVGVPTGSRTSPVGESLPGEQVLSASSGSDLPPKPEAPNTDAPGATHNAAPPSGTSSLAAGRLSSEFGKGITISNTADSFSLNIRARLQFRASEVLIASRPSTSASEFIIRRARISLQGRLFSKHWQYNVQLAFASLDTEPDLRLPLRDAYVTWSRLRDLNLRLGQMKVPFDRQRVTSSSALQMVDRSIVVSELNLDRDVGVQILSNDFLGLGGRLRYQAGIFGGDGRNRTSDAPGILWVGRLQLQPFGPFDDGTESDFERTSRPRLALAASVAGNHDSNRAQSTFGTTYRFARFDHQHWGGDLLFKWAGFSLLGQAMSRRASQPYSEAVQDGRVSREYSRSAWGYFIQSGYLFKGNIELAGRYGRLRPLGLTDPGLHPMREIGPSLSWYLKENILKVQSDYFYLTGEPRQDERRHQLRLQMQVYF